MDTLIPYTTLFRSGVAGAQQEEGGVHVEHALVQEDVADAEDIAQHHDGELQQHHGQGQPAHRRPDGDVHGLEPGNPNLHAFRSEEHTSELQSLMRISYAVFCLKKKKKQTYTTTSYNIHTPQ